MLWIEQNYPVADTLPDETLEAWVARGAPRCAPSWWIWAPAGPGDADPIYGPYASREAAREAATVLKLDVLDSYPCGCSMHRDEN